MCVCLRFVHPPPAAGKLSVVARLGDDFPLASKKKIPLGFRAAWLFSCVGLLETGLAGLSRLIRV